MNFIFTSYMAMINDLLERESEMSKHFEEKAKQAKQSYWDACKYPRKTKKEMRKKALVDYCLYKELARPLSEQLKYTF